MSSSSRGKWSAVGSLVSAPVRGYYYPGRVKVVKKPLDGSSPLLYSVVFSNPLGSLEESDEPGLTVDFTADELIGRGFEPITRALLSKNQKVFITYRSREVSARVVKHDTSRDDVSLVLDSDSQQMSVRLHEVRLLPSRKSGRLQEHPDYSLLANGRRSPDEDHVSTKAKSTGRRRTVSSSSTSLLSESTGATRTQQVSAHIDVPAQTGRKRRPSNPDVMDECAAALVLMSLSASPRSPTLIERNGSCPTNNNTTKIYKCTWPGCSHETFNCTHMEKHIRQDHLNKMDKDNADEEMMSGEEDFYFTEVDVNCDRELWRQFPATAAITSSSSSISRHSSGPESPVSLLEDAASSSSSSSSVVMTTGTDNSMDSSPPSPLTTGNGHFFKSNSAFVPVQHYRHLEDHEYNRRPDPAGISILGSGRRGRKSTNSSAVSPSGATASSHPINIPTSMEPKDGCQPLTMSASFGGFSGASSLSSGFGSYTGSFGSSFSPVSPPRSSGSLSSSLSSTSNKYLRIGAGRGGGSSGTTLLQNGINRTSPTKRVRGETRKCRKVYGMEKKESWCTQCKWKKACTRFTD